MISKTAGKMPLWASITQLYGFVYCMILSNMLTELPVYGGVLYLCGKAVIIFAEIAGRDRKFLPHYAKRWVILLLVFLLAVGFLLVGLFPADIRSGKTWVLYAAVALCICVEANIDRLSRFLRKDEQISLRTKAAGFLLQFLILGGMSAILFYNFGWKNGWGPAVGFLVIVLNRTYVTYRLLGIGDQMDYDYEDHFQETDFRNAHAYLSMEWVSLLLVMSVELTVTSIYALLATNRDGLFSAMMIAVVCTALPAEFGFLLLRKSEKRGRKDPTWLLCIGLILWLCGIILCIQMLVAGKIDYLRIYVTLVICTAGGSLSMTGLGRIEELMPEAVTASGREVPRGYWKLRTTNWNLARLLGDTLALIALGIFCFVNRKGLPQTTEELAARFQPVMSVPVFLVVIGALVSAFRFPLSSRYIEKIRKMMKLQEKGQENKALQEQVARVISEPYRQPYLSRFLIFLCRLHFRCKVKNADHIIPDDRNPIVFLCNHGEFYGPMACKMYIPVPIRAWAISSMMHDPKSVTEYIYTNTTSRQEGMPEFWKRFLARLAAWLSVNVMSQLECIPVYRDSPLKLRETFRMTLEAMEAGDNILIFPESPEQKYPSEGIGDLSPGFLMLADIYWKRKKKRLRMMPMYADKKRRAVVFGEIIEYDPANDPEAERNRIIGETLRQIRAFADGKTEGGDSE
ncbi:MAG: hypothetical protein IKH81_00505 [Clostridia bacterium]|nr:hypothetical protein [Clostridia bacterium]